jgi:hypothetical protein
MLWLVEPLPETHQMLTRLALLAASLAASAALAVGLAAFGLAPAPSVGSIDAVEPVAATPDTITPQPVIEEDTVYVVPPTPAPTAEPTPSPIIVTRVVTKHHGDDDGGEHGDDD